jgi:hypothetical protein
MMVGVVMQNKGFECDDCRKSDTCESAGAEEFDGKAENCPDFERKKFIPAKTWRKMTSTEIVDSLEIAVRVLKEKQIESTNDIDKLLLVISDIAEKLAEAKPM